MREIVHMSLIISPVSVIQIQTLMYMLIYSILKKEAILQKCHNVLFHNHISLGLAWPCNPNGIRKISSNYPLTDHFHSVAECRALFEYLLKYLYMKARSKNKEIYKYIHILGVRIAWNCWWDMIERKEKELKPSLSRSLWSYSSAQWSMISEASCRSMERSGKAWFTTMWYCQQAFTISRTSFQWCG